LGIAFVIFMDVACLMIMKTRTPEQRDRFMGKLILLLIIDWSVEPLIYLMIQYIFARSIQSIPMESRDPELMPKIVDQSLLELFVRLLRKFFNISRIHCRVDLKLR